MAEQPSMPEPKFGAYCTEVGARFDELFRGLQKDEKRVVPSRAALTLPRARDLSRYLTVSELIGPKNVIVRLAGTAVCERIGIDGTGWNYFDFVRADEHDNYAYHFDTVLPHPCGAAALVIEHYDALESIVEQVNFPFTDKSGRVCFNIAVSCATDPDAFIVSPGIARSSGRALAYRPIDIGAGVPAGR